MSESIRKALRDVETAENTLSEKSCDYHVRKAQALALIAIAEQMERANEIEGRKNELLNRAITWGWGKK